MVTVRDDKTMRPFVPLPPGDQPVAVVRQFQELQQIIERMQERIEDLEARVP